jgi:hypothetical protein
LKLPLLIVMCLNGANFTVSAGEVQVSAIAAAGKQNIKTDRANAKKLADRIVFFIEFMMVLLVDFLIGGETKLYFCLYTYKTNPEVNF